MKKSKWKKVIGWICGSIAALLILTVAGLWAMFGTFIVAAESIEKLENGLYFMEYSGDYGFDGFLENGGAASDGEVAAYLTEYLSHGFYHADAEVKTGNFGCSTICATSENGGILFGRNYDWEECNAMIIHTKPKNGYESFSTCCLDFLGFGEGYAPDGSMLERMQTLAAIYVPLDGMNEKGLMVADLMAGDDEATHQQSDKPDLTTTTAIRLMLDKGANVDEAISLLKQYDMNSSIGAAHHFSIADASGRSVVVEYVNGEMIVTDTKVVTNHYIADCDKQGVGSEQSHLRFDTLSEYSGSADEMGVRDMLRSVAQMNYPQTNGSYEKTMWSIVYNPDALCADFYFSENYEQGYGLSLHENGSFIKR